MTTLKELATHLGLSPATVSRALNGFPEVGAKTRARVLEASEQLNYKANPSARKLATGRSDMVGIIFRSTRNLLVDPHFVDFLAGLSGGLAGSGIDLVLHTAPKGEQLAHYRRFISSGTVDGMIISAPKIDDPRVEMLMAEGFPFVVHGRTVKNPDYAYFDIDNEGAFTAATELLTDLGHKRIALLNGSKDMAFAGTREDAFIRTITARGINVPQQFICNDDMSEDQGYLHAAAMIAGQYGTPPTAFLCSSTLQALGVMRAAGAAGLTIGRDISIIAHDDVLPHLRAEHFNTPLTVTRAPIRDAGSALSHMIIALIGGSEPKSLQHIAPVDLIVRGSTGAAPGQDDKVW